MKDKIEIRTNEEYIESVTITDDKGNIETTDILNVAKIEQENLVEFIKDKLKKLKMLREHKENKKNKMLKLAGILTTICGISSIAAIILSCTNIFSFLAFNISLPPLIGFAVMASVIVIICIPYMIESIPVGRTKYDDVIDELEKDLQEEELKNMILADAKTKESICEFNISSRLLDIVSEKYSFEYGKVYTDADYKYDRIMRKKAAKEKKKRIESIDEYVNYDEIDKPKTLGSKKK